MLRLVIDKTTKKMSEYVLEENIEMPKRKAYKLKYPWDKLEVGKSFLVDAKSAADIRNSGYAYFRSRKIKVTLIIRVDGKDSAKKRIFRMK
jgi:hypothetical protein